MAYQRQLVLYFIVLQLITPSFVSPKRVRVNFHQALMPADEVIAYIKSFLHRFSLDMKSNKKLEIEDYAEDLYSRIEDLMTKESFVKLLKVTRDITDKKGQSDYGSSPGVSCSSSAIFKPSLENILQNWDKSNKMLLQLEKWQRENEKRRPSELCNRFKGLTCASGQSSTCQCDGDPNEVGFFSPPVAAGKQQSLNDRPYTEGCYIKPWKPCQLLLQEDNRRILAQVIFPVPRAHTCKPGSNCRDLLPGMNKPICWCSAKSLDDECKPKGRTMNISIPLDEDFLLIRKSFTKLFIAENDKKTKCSQEYNAYIAKLSENAGPNPSVTGAVAIMKKLLNETSPWKKIRICDFRKSLICVDQTCKQSLVCGTSVCSPNYICREKEGKKTCQPDCLSPTFDGSDECSESFVKKLAKGRHFSDEEEIEHEAKPEASHDIDAGLNFMKQRQQDREDDDGEITDEMTEPPSDDSSTDEPLTQEPEPTVPTTSKGGGGGHGAACTIHTDCDAKKFLACYNRECLCIKGLLYNKVKLACEIPIGDFCGQTLIDAHNISSDITLPSCYRAAECLKINCHFFCRSVKGAMIVPKYEHDRLIRNADQMADGGVLLRMSKFGMVASCIIAMWTHIMYFLKYLNI